jgi:hypothetical protein
MAANPSIANPSLIPHVAQTVSETSKVKPTLLERSEEVSRRAFGVDGETIANSLRGF